MKNRKSTIKSIMSIGENMKQGKFRVVKAAFVAACLISVMTSGSASSVSAESSGVVRSLPAAKTTTSTSVIRKSKVTKTQIVETSIKTLIVSVLTVGKNSATSNTTSNKGTRVLTNSSSVKTSATTTVKTVKSLTNTTVTTTVVTTKVEKFTKAPLGKLKFTFAMGSAEGMSGVLIKESFERLKFKYGYQGNFVDVASSALVVGGAASGQFEMGSGTTPGTMKVIQNGAPIKFFGENMRNAWLLVSKSSIKSCADMNGVRLGLHSAGSGTTLLYRGWYKRNCATTIKPVELFIAGSPNRLQALISDRVDVTLLEVEDTLGLPASGYGVMSNFSKDLPQIKMALIWGNQTFLEKNPKIAADLVYEVSRLAQEVNQDAAAFKRYILKWTPGYGANIDKIVAAYQLAKLFPEDPGTFFKDLNETAAFFAAAGTLQPGLLAEQMATLTPLKQAMKRLDF